MTSVRGQMIYARETGIRGAEANSDLYPDAMGAPAWYFANVFEKQDFFLKSPPTWHPPQGHHLCLAREDLFHVQVYEKHSPGLARLCPDADHDVLQTLVQQCQMSECRF